MGNNNITVDQGNVRNMHSNHILVTIHYGNQRKSIVIYIKQKLHLYRVLK